MITLLYIVQENCQSVFFNKHNTVKVRSVKSYDKNVFISKLAETKWEKCFFASNINDAWFNYREVCMNILDSVAPIKEIRIKQRTEPWISADILECIQIRDNRFQKFKKSGKSDDYKIIVHSGYGNVPSGTFFPFI